MNIILIGMPGCGKSVCGRGAAKALSMSFLDTDDLIKQNEGLPLKDIIRQKGYDYFEKAEESSVLTLYTKNCVIATGGSMVYSSPAMQALKQDGVVVFLDISFKNMMRRIRSFTKRGVVLKDGLTPKEMYDERHELYTKYADVTIDCNNNSISDTVSKIVQAVKFL